MANKRIIELDVTDVVEADDFLAIDSVSGTTRRIKPIKIGATYEIEDGDHEFTLTGSNGYEHTVHLPVDAVSMTQAEYDALTPEQKADGTTRFITDGQSDVESELWSKVGRQTLDTDAQVLSNAINELKGSIDTNTNDISELESSLEYKSVSNLFSLKSAYTSIIEISDQTSYRVGNIIYVSLTLHRIGNIANGEHDIIQCSVNPKITSVFEKFHDDYGFIIQTNGNGKFQLSTQNRWWFTLAGYILV